MVLHQGELVQLHQRQRESEQGFVAFQEEEVPESDDGTDGQTVDKYCHEPVEGEERQIDVVVFEIGC